MLQTSVLPMDIGIEVTTYRITMNIGQKDRSAKMSKNYGWNRNERMGVQ